MKFFERIVYCLSTFIFISLVYFQIYHDALFRRKIPTKLNERLPVTNTNPPNPTLCSLNYSDYKEVDFQFQSIDDDKPLPKKFVYSAFYDNRKTKQIKVISLLENNYSDLLCVVWLTLTNFKVIRAHVNVIPESANRKYSASFINCPLKNSYIPLFVSIIENECEPIRNKLKVQYIPRSKFLGKFAVCVTPLNLNYSNVDQLIEMISINQLLGASRIYFYNYSVSRNVENILKTFIDRNFVTVFPWHLPMKVHIWPMKKNYIEEIKYFGQMAMLNDCLYRTMGYYKYVVFSDLDEYLIPRKHRNWDELFQEIINKKYAHAKGWVFRNIFFKTEWPNDREMESNKTITDLKAMSLLKVRRENNIYIPFIRSKLILDPLAVNIVGIHNVWSFQPKAVLDVLTPDEGLCHHYRFWDGLGDQKFVIDKNIFRLKEDLIRILQKNRQFI